MSLKTSSTIPAYLSFFIYTKRLRGISSSNKAEPIPAGRESPLKIILLTLFKQFEPSFFTVAGISISFISMHPRNASQPISSSPSCNVICSRNVQFSNAPPQMFFTWFGISIFLICSHLPRRSMHFIPAPKLICCILQLSNAELAINVKVEGKEMDVTLQ